MGISIFDSGEFSHGFLPDSRPGELYHPGWERALHNALNTIELIFRGRQVPGGVRPRVHVEPVVEQKIPTWVWALFLFAAVLLVVRK